MLSNLTWVAQYYDSRTYEVGYTGDYENDCWTVGCDFPNHPCIKQDHDYAYPYEDNRCRFRRY